MARVYTVPAYMPFLSSLVDGLWRRIDILAQHNGTNRYRLMAQTQIYLPTRRAVDAVRSAFAQRLNHGGMILPHMASLGDIQDDDPAHEQPPYGTIIDRFESIVFLTQLVGKTRRSDILSLGTIQLAKRIDHFLQRLRIENITLEELENIPNPDQSDYWDDILAHLIPVARLWEKELNKRNLIDSQTAQAQHLQSLADNWKRRPPSTPVIVAGSTGSRPSTANFISQLLTLKHGWLILPGLDQQMEGHHWSKLASDQAWTHPQHALSKLLLKLDVPRYSVRRWSSGRIDSNQEMRRARYHGVARALDRVMDIQTSHSVDKGLTICACRNDHEEALTISSIIRNGLEKGQKTSLITANRTLAKKVIFQLKRWNISANDSSGQKLADSQLWIFLRLIIDAAWSRWAPVPLLAMLKHPLTTAGMDEATLAHRRQLLEATLLRGLRPGSGFAGLRQALEHSQVILSKPNRKKQDYASLDDIATFIKDLETILGPLGNALHGQNRLKLGEIAQLHWKAARDLAKSNGQDTPHFMDNDVDGEAYRITDKLFSKLAKITSPISVGSHYLDVLLEMVDEQIIPPTIIHPDIMILGTLEARLQHDGLVILSGLNEGSWPPTATQDLWLNRQMCHQLNIPPPEWRIGLAAHDFVQAFSADDIFLTYSRYTLGQPTQVARWIRRLDHAITDKPLTRGQAVIQDVHNSEYAVARHTIERPRPCPKQRPHNLSISNIRTLIRDPYAFYGEKILGLKPLAPVDEPFSNRFIGILVHQILAQAHKRGKWTEANKMMAQAIKALSQLHSLNQKLYWHQRLQRLFETFLRQEDAYSTIILDSEIKGRYNSPNGWSLHGRADRIDRLDDNSYAIIDYKSGQLPAKKDVLSGMEPQLLLEALILERGRFGGHQGKVGDIYYIDLKPLHSSDDAAKQRRPHLKDFDFDGLEKQLEQFLDIYLRPTTLLCAVPRPGLWDSEDKTRLRPYPWRHLERREEWLS